MFIVLVFLQRQRQWQCQIIRPLSFSASPTVKARFERVLESAARSPLYMKIAAALGIALVIEKGLSLKVKKVKDQQVGRLGHGPSLDENIT